MKQTMGISLIIFGIVTLGFGFFLLATAPKGDVGQTAKSAKPVLEPWSIVCDSNGNHTFIAEDGKPWTALFREREEAVAFRDSWRTVIEERGAKELERINSGERAAFSALYNQVRATEWKPCP